MIDSIKVALKGKGILHFTQRVGTIIKNYGVTTHRQDSDLAKIFAFLGATGPATFPVVATVLMRNAKTILKHNTANIEMAIHGYAHVDYSQLSFDVQLTHLRHAQSIFRKFGIEPRGFRAPYLRVNDQTLRVLSKLGLLYDSSRAINWDIGPEHNAYTYEKALRFYRATPATDTVCVPYFAGNLVRIPYCLPDDEALIQRLGLSRSEDISQIWLEILRRTYQLGELFTLGVHPERADLYIAALQAVLSEARRQSPPVWIARLDDIARWWRMRQQIRVHTTIMERNMIQFEVYGSDRATILARAVRVDAPTTPWADGYHHIKAPTFTVYAPVCPYIGVSPRTCPELSTFLQEQGYIIETSEHASSFAYYFDQNSFKEKDKRSMLQRLEQQKRPLVRIGRWPDGTRSALSISGDIDAVTLWDYTSRLLSAGKRNGKKHSDTTHLCHTSTRCL